MKFGIGKKLAWLMIALGWVVVVLGAIGPYLSPMIGLNPGFRAFGIFVLAAGLWSILLGYMALAVFVIAERA